MEHRFAIEEKKVEKIEKKTRLDKSMAKSKSILQTKLEKGEKGDCEHVLYIFLWFDPHVFTP